MIKKIFFFLFCIHSSSFLFACSWCEKWNLADSSSSVVLAHKEVDLSKEIQEVQENPKTDLLDDDSDLDDLDDLDDDQEEDCLKEVTSEAGKKFYLEYLEKYYPKALVIIDYFQEMCPIALNSALLEVVDILSSKEWFYYQNKPEGFSAGEYWEVTLDQCVRISSFLNRSFFDLQKHLVSDNFLDCDEDSEIIPLLFYLKQSGLQAHFYFYAEYADRLVKLFNEGINNSNFKKARRYNLLYARVIKNLNGFTDCISYEEVAKIQKELIAILRLEQSKK